MTGEELSSDRNKHKPFSAGWEIEQLVRRIEAGENPFALSTGERIAASFIYMRPEWRPEPYGELDIALKRLGDWREATLNYCRTYGLKTWKG